MALAGGSSRRLAADATGMHRATFYRLLKKDSNFRERVEEAESDGAEVRNYRR